jgi:creatinine amidohydrolase
VTTVGKPHAAPGAVTPSSRHLYFADLAYPQIEDLVRAERPTVLLFPVGATEPHGPHSPLCTDPLISTGMCERAAGRLRGDAELGALILPTLPFGVTRYARSFGGAISVGEAALHAMVTEVCRSVVAQGFRFVMIVNNHFEPEHVQTLHRACDTVEADLGVVVGYLDLTRRERSHRLTEEFVRGECHAGRYETSLVLADRPELVDRALMGGLPPVPVNLAKVIADGIKEFKQMGLTRAYCGSPADAGAEEGRAVYETLTDMLVDLMRALVRGEGGRDRPGLFGRV